MYETDEEQSSSDGSSSGIEIEVVKSLEIEDAVDCASASKSPSGTEEDEAPDAFKEDDHHLRLRQLTKVAVCSQPYHLDCI